LEYLLRHDDVDVNAQDRSGSTALHIAVILALDRNLLELLGAHEPNLHIWNKAGLSVLDYIDLLPHLTQAWVTALLTLKHWYGHTLKQWMIT